MREFTFSPLSESRSAPGGHQLIGLAANLTFESACRLLWARHSPTTMYYMLSYEVDIDTQLIIESFAIM